MSVPSSLSFYAYRHTLKDLVHTHGGSRLYMLQCLFVGDSV